MHLKEIQVPTATYAIHSQHSRPSVAFIIFITAANQ
jgi:hypothetical protein